jgi:uncharacterized protein (TIGR03437 family)
MPSSVRVLIRPADSEYVEAKVLEIPYGQTALALVPPEMPAGSAQIMLDTGDERSAPAAGEIVSNAFRLFSIDNGSGPALSENGLAHPASAGDIVQLWGTGLNGAGITAYVGGQPAEVSYAGPAPDQPGVDQLNLRIPDGVVEGCYTEVKLTADGQPVNTVTLTTGSGPCQHSLGLTPEQLRELDAGRSVTAATGGIYSIIGPPPGTTPRWDVATRIETANVSIMNLDAKRAATYRPSRIAPGSCEFNPATGTQAFIEGGGEPVSFGPALRLRGPDRTLLLSPPDAEHATSYDAALPVPEPVPSPGNLPPTAWTPGQWTLESEGSSEVPPFSVEVPIGATLEVTNYDEARTVDRRTDLTVRWRAEGLPADTRVSLWLGGDRSSVICQARGQDGAITIPRDVLSGLTPVSANSTVPATLSLSAGPPADQPMLFPVKRAGGETIPLVFTQGSGVFFSVTIR